MIDSFLQNNDKHRFAFLVRMVFVRDMTPIENFLFCSIHLDMLLICIKKTVRFFDPVGKKMRHKNRSLLFHVLNRPFCLKQILILYCKFFMQLCVALFFFFGLASECKKKT